MSESINRLLAELHAERQRSWEPQALQANIEQRRRLVEQARPETFVKRGDRLAPFELLRVEGGSLGLDQLVADGPAVLVFFRFAGCPACNIAIPYYQRNLHPALQALGVPLLAVSPQRPERLLEIKDKHRLTLQVASDPGNALGRRFGILYSLDEATRRKQPQFGELIGNDTWELPQPTVVVIGADRRVHFAEVSPDWLVRCEAQPIIDAVAPLVDAASERTPARTA
jgi:peroxiredoxin